MTDSEVCPKCGNFVEVLRDDTGFCLKCSKPYKYDVSAYDKFEYFLAEYADHIEHYIEQGQDLTNAIRSVYNDYKPRCASCGVVMKRAAKSAVFCRSNARCRRASRRYVYLYSERDKTKSEALAIVLSELTGE